MNYEKKYFKYKKKYLNLKNQIAGEPFQVLYIIPKPDPDEIKLFTSINQFLESKGGLIIDKPQLLSHLESINKCWEKNEKGEYIYVGDKKWMTGICKNIHTSQKIIIGIRDVNSETGQESYAFMDINFDKAESHSILYISWTVSSSDTPGKARALVEIANELAKYLKLKYLQLVCTPDSKSFWEHMKFSCDSISNVCTKVVV